MLQSSILGPSWWLIIFCLSTALFFSEGSYIYVRSRSFWHLHSDGIACVHVRMAWTLQQPTALFFFHVTAYTNSFHEFFWIRYISSQLTRVSWSSSSVNWTKKTSSSFRIIISNYYVLESHARIDQILACMCLVCDYINDYDWTLHQINSSLFF